MTAPSSANGGYDRHDVRRFGARPDGQTSCTGAIQAAIDAAAASGGGAVHLPAGVWRSGTLYLRSHITLWLDAGCTLLGSPDLADYPHNVPAIRSYSDRYTTQSLIAGEGLEDVALCGRGTIDGNAAAFPVRGHRIRPFVVRLVDCRQVLVEGLTFRNAPTLTQHYLACDGLAVRGLTVYCHTNENNDGLDIDGCRDVRVTDCTIDSDDDALVLKSTLDRPCENVTISGCVLSSRCNAIKMGTESNGGFRNVAIANCAISSSRAPVDAALRRGAHAVAESGERRGLAGIALELVDGGQLDGIAISNITMRGVAVAFFLRLGNRARPFIKDGPPPGMGTLRNVVLSHIVATGTSSVGCSITGIPGHPVENVSVSHVCLGVDGGGTRELASREVPERETAAPESTMFGLLPAYGLYARHVRRLGLFDVHVETTRPDERHALVLEDVEDACVDAWNAVGGAGGCAPIRLTQSRRVLVRGCRLPDGAATLLKVEGEGTDGIVLSANGGGRVAALAERGPGVTPHAVTTD